MQASPASQKEVVRRTAKKIRRAQPKDRAAKASSVKPTGKRAEAPRRQKPPVLTTPTPLTPPAAALIVVAGMRHSASTALFNILRLGFARVGARVLSGYSEHQQTAEILFRKDALRLIKTHEFRDDIAAAANLVFTARRDLRDTVASAARRDFTLYRQLRTPVEYAKYNRMLYDVWAPHSDFEFVYEEFIADPVAVTGDVLEAVGLARSWAPEICREVLQLPTDDYDTTLLTPQHITDPTHKLSFGDTLALHDVKTIEAHHYKWLRRHGYARGSEKEE